VFAAFRTAIVVLLAVGAGMLWPADVRAQRGGNAGAQRQPGGADQTGGGGPGGQGGFAGGFFRGRGELPTGTGVIRGRVVSDTGAPVRRAQVRASVVGQPGPAGRVAATDANGVFELRDLPAGQYSLSASKAGYVTQRYGQKRAFETVPPIQLADGQRLDGANFALLRGGVITGRVLDDAGEPAANVRVQVQRSQLVEGRRRLVNVGINDETDDTGAFRLYGLAPGDYFVIATVRTSPIDSSIDGAGYAPTYYPGTGNPNEAQRVAVAAGEELSIGFSLLPVRLVRVSGTVVSSSGDAAGGMVMLTSADGTEGVGIAAGSPIQANGVFTIANVAPGSYVLNARSGFGGPRRNPGGGDVEIGSVPLVVGDGDVTGITIATNRGASIAGTIVAEGGASITLSNLRVSARQVRSAFGGSGNSTSPVTAAGAFQLSALSGTTSLRVDGLTSQWAVKSITVGSVDVTDGALELRGTEQVTSARIILTDRISEVNGTVTLHDQPAKDYSVVIFADDPALWTFPTRYVRTARGDAQGQFTIRGLPPAATYLAAAVSYLEDNEWQDPEFLERLRDASSRVSLREGETKTIGLRLLER